MHPRKGCARRRSGFETAETGWFCGSLDIQNVFMQCMPIILVHYTNMFSKHCLRIYVYLESDLQKAEKGMRKEECEKQLRPVG